ncbi:hypothetical protein [Corallococcus sp. 4LFB]|uniref:hypothetical protein n=1 Tax=Corallococcus sp. 4LFB TaxID=3383249 RepID=UPI0039749705
MDRVPHRDEGLEPHGEGGGGRWQYSLAVVNGDPDGASTDASTDDSRTPSCPASSSRSERRPAP